MPMLQNQSHGCDLLEREVVTIEVPCADSGEASGIDATPQQKQNAERLLPSVMVKRPSQQDMLGSFRKLRAARATASESELVIESVALATDERSLQSAICRAGE